MTIQQFVDSIATEINQPFNHGLKELTKIDARLLISTRMRQQFEKHGIDLQYRLSYQDDLVLTHEPGICEGNCQVLKTTKTIPLTIRYNSDNVYLFFGKPDGTPIPVGSVTEYKLRKNFRLSKDEPFGVIHNKYGYVFGTTTLGRLRIDDIFENQSMIKDICDPTCITDDTDLLIPMDILYEIKVELIRKLRGEGRHEDNEVTPTKVPVQ